MKLANDRSVVLHKGNHAWKRSANSNNQRASSMTAMSGDRSFRDASGNSDPPKRRKRDDIKEAWNQSLLSRAGRKWMPGDKHGSETHETPSRQDVVNKEFSAPPMVSGSSPYGLSGPQSAIPERPASTAPLGEKFAIDTVTELDLAEQKVAETQKPILQKSFSFESSGASGEFGSVINRRNSDRGRTQCRHDSEEPEDTATSSTGKMTESKPQVTADDVLSMQRQLGSIKESILTRGYNFPELKPPVNASVEAWVSQSLDEYCKLSGISKVQSKQLQDIREQLRYFKNIETKLRETEMELRTCRGKLIEQETGLREARKDNETREGRHGANLRDLNGQIRNLERRLTEQATAHKEQMTSRHHDLMQEIGRLKSLHEQQMQQVRFQSATENERFRKNAESWTSQLQNERAGHHQRTQEMQYDHEWRMASAKEDYTNRLREKDRGFEQQLSGVHEANRVGLQRLQLQINQLTADLEQEKARSREQLRLQKARLDKEHEDDLRQHDEDLERAREEKESLVIAHRQELWRLEENLKTEKKKLAIEHQKDTAQLRSVAEELKGALVVRDHYKGLKDRDLASRYKRLSIEIEGFSSMQWDAHLETAWPLSEAQLLRLHPKNTRRLKQQIVQHSIWLFLHERIFSLPFRILGAEGAPLNSAWTEIHAPGE
ncbi:hypothetical protein BDW02DRAFT_200369 [Decorospora gaudefroyi]|uniref:Uncharacterized protein n=1 Tax=Decorospora gaudefroyi TaxID=184978 RepID=A0A6A5JWB5_9PLEO|nr:hypothetical protein BDW02DRAFT_200369 [Decorospora gaudefroyi]